MKGNVIQLNTLHLNSVRLNGIGKVQSASLKGGSTEEPIYPPVEPPVEPTPTYTLSASVTNGKVSAKRNGSAVNLPFTANEGDVIVLEVTPNDGYSFEGWADGVTDNPRTITMTADVVLSAQCVEVVAPPVGNYIQFEDKAVEAICVANWSSDGIGLTEEDAAAVTTIGTTFKGNTEITSFDELRYFTGVTTINVNAFKGCTALRTISFEHITKVGNDASWNAGAFDGCTSLERAIMPKVTEIANYSFANCSSLAEAYMPNVTLIGASAFKGSRIGGSHTIEYCQSIGASAFKGTYIEEIIAPSLTSITGQWEGGSFADCRSLRTVRVGDATALGERTFLNCSALETFIISATTPPSLNAALFSNTNSTFLIYVPDASLEAYKTATNWNTYADRIHPLSEIEGGHITTYEGLIGAYTFEGRSNEDADRDIVEDKSGYNNTLTLKSMLWGYVDSGYPDLVREGLWDDALWLSVSGYGEITLPNGLTDFTVIAKRFVFSANAGGNWSPLVGTGKSSGKGLFWLEYNAGDGIYTTQVNGLNYTLPSLESEVTWLTNTHYNGHRLTGTQGNDVHDGMVYINKFRGDVNGVRFQKIYAIYLFNRQLSPSEIEAFIKEKIDDSYILPTIEQ